MAIVDRVHQGQMDWQDAQKVLKDLPDDQRHALQNMVMRRYRRATPPAGVRGISPEAATQPLDELKAISKPGPSPGGIIKNLGKDIEGAVKGFIPGIALAGKAVGKDIGTVIHDPSLKQSSIYQYATGGKAPESATQKQVINPLGKSEKELWGPLVTGHPGEFAKRVSDHPLAPVLDAFAVASMGIGAGGRIVALSRATKAADVSRDSAGIAQVGASAGLKLKVVPKANGRWQVLDRTKPVASSFPTEKAAIIHAQSLATGGLSGNVFKVGLNAATRRGAQGNLVDAWDKMRGNTHEAENNMVAEEIASIFDDPNIQVGQPGLKGALKEKGRQIAQSVGQVPADIKQTRYAGKTKAADIQAKNIPFIGRTTSKIAATAGTGLREASDGVRAGAIYLRPAYLPNNWAGNTFMNVVDQGAFAPINLAKSALIHRHMDPENVVAFRRAMGQTPADAVTMGRGRGYVASVTHPIAHVMGALADQPFRDAAFFQELRRAGYSTVREINDLFNNARGYQASAASKDALMTIANSARRAQENIVKFGKFNDTERSVLRNLVFVYSWIRGATRYGARFPMQHPIQAAVFNQASHEGNKWLDKEMGGVPSFLIGAIPVGRDKDGNPILINPLSLNPLGTVLQVGQAAAGTYNVIAHGGQGFNKFAQTDVLNLANPLVQAYFKGREGGQPVGKQALKSVAGYRLYEDLKHPGRGGIYPTTRKEALGQFAVGATYPRKASQEAITRSLEREGADNPIALIPEKLKEYKKLTGQSLDPQFVAAYEADIVNSQQQRDFQHSYADRHGQSGFRNMPPQNRAEAAVEYLRRHKLMPEKQLNSLSDSLNSITTDEAFNDLANTLWSMTGAGTVKRIWDQVMHDAKSLSKRRRVP